MILVDGQEFKYVTFPDGTIDFISNDVLSISNITWKYDGNLSEAFVCLSLLDHNMVSSFDFIFLPYARQDKGARFQVGGFGGLYSFISLFVSVSPATKYSVEDAHNPNALPHNWINRYNPFVVPGCDTSLIIFPDQGAMNKYKDHYTHVKCISAVKSRCQKTGKINDINLCESVFENIENIYVIDDICDGGATFIELHALLPKRPKKYLFTTYGIYSKGLSLLEQYYDVVKCQHQVFPHREKL